MKKLIREKKKLAKKGIHFEFDEDTEDLDVTSNNNDINDIQDPNEEDFDDD